MDGLLSIILSTFKSRNINEKDIENVNGYVNEEMKLFGWIMIEIYKDMCLLIRINDGGEIEEGYYLNKEEVLEMNGKDNIITIRETIDKENGVRFEGSVFEGIPFGFGLLFDENGNRMYEGMVINWNRMGYGNSFNENGYKEYEGYWCNDLRCGSGKSFDLEGNITYEGNWFEGVKEGQYEGDGSSLHIKMNHLRLLNRCILRCFDVSLFTLLEELIIGYECFKNVDTFRIDELGHLKSIKIGLYSFTHLKCTDEWGYKKANNPSRSFHILVDSFSDYSGEFELKNLPSLSSIKIGITGERYIHSSNFCYSSFVVKGLPNLQSIELGNDAFEYSLSTIISNLPNLKSIQLGYDALYGRNDDSCCLEMKDLPKLERITSRGCSFFSPRSMILSNIPNLKEVNLPDGHKGKKPFEYLICSTIEDVHKLFASIIPITHDFSYIQSLDSTITSINLPDWTCNDLNYTTFNFSRFSLLEDLIIGDDSFYSVYTFRIDGLNDLKSIKIGMNSFTKKKNDCDDNSSRSFHILNCDKLESIKIGEFSFCGYGGEFELKNLPSLSSIKIGEIGSDSWNFCYSSFVVKDLPSLQSIELGNWAFGSGLSTLISNLPNLKSILLGKFALYGRNDDSCCLEMKDLPKLEEIINSDRWGFSFCYLRSVILSNIPNLKEVNLPRSFRYVKTKSISSIGMNMFLLFSLILSKSMKVTDGQEEEESTEDSNSTSSDDSEPAVDPNYMNNSNNSNDTNYIVC